MKDMIKKVIKPDIDKKEVQVILSIDAENNITFGISQKGDSLICDMSYNQLCVLNKIIEKAIDKHYQKFSSDMSKEKTQTIYYDDPVDW